MPRLTSIMAAILVVFIGSPVAGGLLGDFLWFQALDLVAVFSTMLLYRAVAFVGSFVLVSGAIILSHRYACHRLGRAPSRAFTAVIAIVAGLIGYSTSQQWDNVLKFVHSTGFGLSEPITGTSVEFFVYTFPIARLTVLVAGLAIMGCWAALAWVYLREAVGDGDMDMDAVDVMMAMEGQAGPSGPSMWDLLGTIKEAGLGQVRVLSGLSLFVVAAWFGLERFGLFLSEYGAVYGVGTTQATVVLPALSAGAFLAAVAGVVVIVSRWIGGRRLVGFSVALVVLAGIGGPLASMGMQGLIVEPDEYNRERPYLEHQINMTRHGFGLDRIDEQQFRPSPNLSIEEIEDNPGTMDNIRLWDYRPLQRTYNEMQIFRTYYQFSDVDIDRYNIDGMEKQVMLSPREIDLSSLPSQSWVNRHLVYTHSFGVAMSPVDKVTDQGLPEYYIKDIPPRSSVGINVTQPRIYYGEETDTYAITRTGTEELDYPSGENNVYGSYQGDGGVMLDSLWKRVLFAWRFQDPQILLSGSIKDRSRLLFERTIQDRVRKAAPFLAFDDDPYIVVDDDGLKWIYDAYTRTDSFPYAEHTWFKGEMTNYVRNSVKVVVDAYSGDISFYVADEDDPLIQTYSDAFPSMFEPMSAMDDDLKDHIRYPEDYFTTQTQMYFDYHMTDPRVFYNKEDQWRTPQETLRGTKSDIEPYYVMMQLPDGEGAEFMMIQPFIPQQRENLIGWVGARSDRPNYGEMEAYLFSKQELVYGPAQVDARIDQDTQISRQFTLWSQRGSSVYRGNLLAIPLEDSLIYVEPVYLVSEGSGALPQLRRTIVSHNDRLTMQPSLDMAVETLFGDLEEEDVTGPVVSPGVLDEVRELYREAQDALEDGDFSTYADRIEAIGQRLEESGNVTVQE